MPSILSRVGDSLNTKARKAKANSNTEQENINFAAQGFLVECELYKINCHNKRCENRFSVIQSHIKEQGNVKVAKVAQKIGNTTCSITISHDPDAVAVTEQKKFGKLTTVSDERTFVKCLKCSCQTEICIQCRAREDGGKSFYVCSVTAQEQCEARKRVIAYKKEAAKK